MSKMFTTIGTVTLSDTFHEWYTSTNEIISALNPLDVYDVTAVDGTGPGSGISIARGGVQNGTLTLSFQLPEVVTGTHNFTGDVFFTGNNVIVEATTVQFDDFVLELGSVSGGGGTVTFDGGTSDAIIEAAGGGGIKLLGTTQDKSWIWRWPDSAWVSSENIALAANKSLIPQDDVFRVKSSTVGAGFQVTVYDGSTAVDFSYLGTAGGATEAFKIHDDGFVRIHTGANRKLVFQTGHGYFHGNVLYHNGTNYQLANASSVITSEAIGVVDRTNIVDADKFELVLQGEIGGFDGVADGATTLSAGQVYFLSNTTDGEITSSPVTTVGHIRKPMFVSIGATSALVVNYIGNIVPDPVATTTFDIGSGANYLVRHDIVGVQTTTGVQTTLTTDAGAVDGNNNLLVIPDNSTWSFEGQCSAREVGAGGTYAGWKFEGLVDNVGSVVSVTASTITLLGGTNFGWDLSLAAGASSVDLKGTGINTTTVNWTGFFNIVQTKD